VEIEEERGTATLDRKNEPDNYSYEQDTWTDKAFFGHHVEGRKALVVCGRRTGNPQCSTPLPPDEDT